MSCPLSSAFSLSIAVAAAAARTAATWTIARWWYLANGGLAACLPACLPARSLPGEQLCQSVLRCWPSGRPSDSDQSTGAEKIYILFFPSFSFSHTFPFSLLFSFPSSPLFCAPGPFAYASLIPPRSDVRIREQEGPQVLRHRDIALHWCRGYCHVFLQVSFYLSRSDVTTNATSSPYTYIPTMMCVWYAGSIDDSVGVLSFPWDLIGIDTKCIDNFDAESIHLWYTVASMVKIGCIANFKSN